MGFAPYFVSGVDFKLIANDMIHAMTRIKIVQFHSFCYYGFFRFFTLLDWTGK